MSKQAIGVVGLAVMGRNLALNIESRGHAVSVYNRSREKTDELIAEHPDKKLVPAFTLEEFVESLEKPRRILLMVKAGEGTDATIDSLRPLLQQGRHPDRRRQHAFHRHHPPQPGPRESRGCISSARACRAARKAR